MTDSTDDYHFAEDYSVAPLIGEQLPQACPCTLSDVGLASGDYNTVCGPLQMIATCWDLCWMTA